MTSSLSLHRHDFRKALEENAGNFGSTSQKAQTPVAAATKAGGKVVHNSTCYDHISSVI